MFCINEVLGSESQSRFASIPHDKLRKGRRSIIPLFPYSPTLLVNGIFTVPYL